MRRIIITYIMICLLLFSILLASLYQRRVTPPMSYTQPIVLTGRAVLSFVKKYYVLIILVLFIVVLKISKRIKV